jgi:hypothetical protein
MEWWGELKSDIQYIKEHLDKNDKKYLTKQQAIIIVLGLFAIDRGWPLILKIFM